jgi:hypothetical protein
VAPGWPCPIKSIAIKERRSPAVNASGLRAFIRPAPPDKGEFKAIQYHKKRSGAKRYFQYFVGTNLAMFFPKDEYIHPP